MPRLNVVDPASASGPVKEISTAPERQASEHLQGHGQLPPWLNFYLAGSALSRTPASRARSRKSSACSSLRQRLRLLPPPTPTSASAGLSEEQTVAARTGGDLGDAKPQRRRQFATRCTRSVATWAMTTSRPSRAGYDDGHIAGFVASAARHLHQLLQPREPDHRRPAHAACCLSSVPKPQRRQWRRLPASVAVFHWGVPPPISLYFHWRRVAAPAHDTLIRSTPCRNNARISLSSPARSTR